MSLSQQSPYIDGVQSGCKTPKAEGLTDAR